MPSNEFELTLALVLSAGGAVAASGLITGLIQLLKSVGGSFVEGKERVWAFGLSAALVVLAYISITVAAQPPTAVGIAGIFAAFLAWFNIARLSMAIYDDLTGRVNGLRGPTE